MQAAFSGSGGQMQLVMLPPFRDDGHTLFFADGGRRRLLPEVDGFLRTHGLPTWDTLPFEPLLTRSSAAEWPEIQEYLLQPTEKALALAPTGGVHWWAGTYTLDEARERAPANCKQQTSSSCRLAAANFHLSDPPPAESKQAQQP